MMDYLLAALVGLALGSFVNVVITRLPLEEQILTGRSRCPSCRTFLPWYDNLPLLSYLWLNGICRFCGAAIPIRYPLVELGGALLTMALWIKFPGNAVLVAYIPFAMALLALSGIDWEHRLLPDAITLPGVGLGLGLSLVLPHISFMEAAGGALAGGLGLWGVGWLYQKWRGRQGLGGGDVKLAAMIGAFVGISLIPLVLFLSAALGTLAGVGMAVAQGDWRGGRWQSRQIPYGPFLAAGAILSLLAGEDTLRLLGEIL